MNGNQKLFAFKLAAKTQSPSEPKDGKWKGRDGVSVAGCTEWGPWDGVYRYPHPLYGADQGVYC